jgi:hypothetical protein
MKKSLRVTVPEIKSFRDKMGVGFCEARLELEQSRVINAIMGLEDSDIKEILLVIARRM